MTKICFRINKWEKLGLSQGTPDSFQEAPETVMSAELAPRRAEIASLRTTPTGLTTNSQSTKGKCGNFALNRKLFERYILQALTLHLCRFGTHQVKFDHQRPATSHKYGCSTIVKPTENLNDANWTTTTRLTFRKPEERTKPQTRVQTACKDILFDKEMERSTRP